MTVTRADIATAASRLSLGGRAVCVHPSIRSFGGLDGGPESLVDGLLDTGTTVLFPTFSIDFSVPPPVDDRPAQNGLDYDKIDATPWEWRGPSMIYSPEWTGIEHWLGATAAYVAARPDRIRGNSPTSSFSAIGPLAPQLIVDSAGDVYGPLRALSELDGFVALMGVGLERMTLLHLAEVMSGRRPFIRWTRDRDGSVIRERGGECSEGFGNLDDVLRPFERRVRVGTSLWRVFAASAAAEAAADAIRADPSITHCGREDCIECRDAILGGPAEPASTARGSPPPPAAG